MSVLVCINMVHVPEKKFAPESGVCCFKNAESHSLRSDGSTMRTNWSNDTDLNNEMWD
jgi:hypothetical protein